MFNISKRHIVKQQSWWSLGANGYGTLSGLLLFMLASRKLSSVDFGTWIFFLATSTLFDMFKTGLVFPGYLQQAAGSSKKEKSNSFNTAIGFFILISLVQIILCQVILLLTDVTSSIYFFAYYYPLLIISNALIMLCEWWWQSQNRFQHILLLRVINRSIIIIASCFWLSSINNLILITIASNAISTFIIVAMRRHPSFSVHQTSKAIASKLAWFAVYATPSQVISNLLKSSNTFIINRYLGNTATGIYGFAARFIEIVELPIRSMGSVHYNHFASIVKTADARTAFSVTLRYMLKTTMLIVPLFIALFILAPYLVLWISNNQFQESSPILQVMAVYCLLIPADRYFGLFLEAMNRPDLNLIKVGIMLLLNIILSILSILVFQTPFAVAVTSIFTFAIGILIGAYLIIFKALPERERRNSQIELACEQ